MSQRLLSSDGQHAEVQKPVGFWGARGLERRWEDKGWRRFYEAQRVGNEQPKPIDSNFVCNCFFVHLLIWKNHIRTPGKVTHEFKKMLTFYRGRKSFKSYVARWTHETITLATSTKRESWPCRTAWVLKNLGYFRVLGIESPVTGGFQYLGFGEKVIFLR